MKPSSLLCMLLLTFLCLRTISQSYDSLVVENAQWQVKSYSNDPPAGGDYKDGWLLRGDTIINEIQYKKLFRRHFEHVNSNHIAWQYLFGYLREDVFNKKVYAIESDGELGCNDTITEYLLFDFSYLVGDTSQLCMHNDWAQYPVLLEEIYYDVLIGEERKLFRFHNIGRDLIEGVGHKGGLIEPIEMDESYYVFLYDYCRGTDEECGIWVKIDEYPGKDSFSIFPNPADNFIRLHFPDSEFHFSKEMNLTINDIFGRIVKEISGLENDYTIDVSDFPDGIYFVTFNDNNMVIASQKLIISRH